MDSRTKKTFTPIAVVGVGALFAGSKNARDYWKNILEKRDLIEEIPQSHWLINDYFEADPKTANANDKIYSKRGSFINDITFDPIEFGIPPATIPAIDTAQLLALVVAKQVLNDVSREQIDQLDLSSTSVILGTSALEAIQYLSARIQRPIWAKALNDIGLSNTLVEKVCDTIANAYPKWQPDSFPGLLSNVVAGRIANRFNCGGTNCTTDAACASSLSAILMAVNELQLGRADMVITGGVDALNDLLMYKCFSIVTALSPSGYCTPFSEKADGTLLGEGIGLFALKRLTDAEANKDHIYGVIRGMGTSSDGRATSIYAPVAKAQSRAVLKAYEEANYPINTVELIEAHGTGTVAGDLAEYNGLFQAFQSTGNAKTHQCALGSVKSQIGHTKSAAGAAGMLKALLALNHKILPPTLHAENPNPKFPLANSPLYLNTETRPWIRGAAHPRRAGVSCFGFGGSNFHVTLEEYTNKQYRAKRFRTLVSEMIVFCGTTPKELLQRLQNATQEDVLKQGLSYIAYESQKNLEKSHLCRLVIVATNMDDFCQKLQQSIDFLDKTSDLPKNFPIAEGVYFGNTQKIGKFAFCFPDIESQYLNMGNDLLMAFDSAMAVWDNLADQTIGGDASLHEIVYPAPTSNIEEKALQEKRLQEKCLAQPALVAASLSWLALLTSLEIQPSSLVGKGFGELTALYAGGAITLKTLLEAAKNHETKKALSASIKAFDFHSSKIDIYGDHLNKRYTAKSKEFLVREKETEKQDAFCQSIRNMYADGVRTFLEIGPNQCLKSLITHSLSDFQDYQVIHLDQPNRNSVTHFWYGLAQLICAGVTPKFQSIWEDYESITPENTEKTNAYTLKINGTNYGKPYPKISITDQSELNFLHKHGNPNMLKEPHQNTEQNKQNEMQKEYAPNDVNPSIVMQPHLSASQQELQRQLFNVHNTMVQSHLAFLNTVGRMMGQGSEAMPNFMPAFPQEIYSMAAPILAPVAPVEHMSAPSVAPSVAYAAKPYVPPAPAPTLSSSIAYSAPQTASSKTDDVNPEQVILSVVVEKTGYPIEMLHADMDIEADLGIDSIKRVEILSAVRERLPFLPEMETSELANLKSLGDITAYIQKHIGQPAQTTSQASKNAPVASASLGNDNLGSAFIQRDTNQLRGLVLEIVVDKTGYPLEMLNENMDIEADLGIDSIKRVEILSSLREKIPELPEMETSELAALKTLGDITAYIGRHSPATKDENLKKKHLNAVH